MISQEQENYLTRFAYIPEHIPSLMTMISRGEAHLVDDCLVLTKDNWCIVVAYPLADFGGSWQGDELLRKALSLNDPEYLWVMAPTLPAALRDKSTERQRDDYLILDLENHQPDGRLQRRIVRAAAELTVSRTKVFSADHQSLTEEFLARGDALPPRIRALYLAMGDYVARSRTALVIDARDGKGNLCAFYVVDLAAQDFTTYLLGCHSRIHATPHASDLVFQAMIDLSREQGKMKINLGLGVNEGIRRFKEKWGGEALVPYDFCEVRYERSWLRSIFRVWSGFTAP